MSTVALNVDAAILARVIAPERAGLSSEAARSLIALSFSEEDRLRMAELAEKARQGSLTSEEQAVIEGYERIGSLIGLLQSKARQSLQKAKGEPG